MASVVDRYSYCSCVFYTCYCPIVVYSVLARFVSYLSSRFIFYSVCRSLYSALCVVDSESLLLDDCFLFVLSYRLDCLFHSCRPCLLLCLCCLCYLLSLQFSIAPVFVPSLGFVLIPIVPSFSIPTFPIIVPPFSTSIVFIVPAFCIPYSFSPLPIAPIVPALSSELSTAPVSIFRILPLCCISHLLFLLLFSPSSMLSSAIASCVILIPTCCLRFLFLSITVPSPCFLLRFLLLPKFCVYCLPRTCVIYLHIEPFSVSSSHTSYRFSIPLIVPDIFYPVCLCRRCVTVCGCTYPYLANKLRRIRVYPGEKKISYRSTKSDRRTHMDSKVMQ